MPDIVDVIGGDGPAGPNAIARSILAGVARGPVLATPEPLSFWGGVDPATGKIIDVHHPLHGRSIAGAVLMMPSDRKSVV